MAQAEQLGPKVTGHPVLVLYSLNEMGQLSQWCATATVLVNPYILLLVIYVKNCSVYIQCKDDIVVVDIKQYKS